MKKYIARILLIAMLLCAMGSLTSCARFNVESVTINGQTYYSGYLYEFKYETTPPAGKPEVGYMYSTEKLKKGDTIYSSNAIVTDIVQKFQILILEGIDTYTISYCQSFPRQSYLTESDAKEYAPNRTTIEIVKEDVNIHYHNRKKTEQ